MRGLNLWIAFRFLILLISVYTLVLLPPLIFLIHNVLPLFQKSIYSILTGTLLFIFNFCLLLLSAVILPGITWRILKLCYGGEHSLDLSQRNVRNWLFSLGLYLPVAVVLDFFHLYPLKTIHIRLFGGKVGKNVVIGGLVLDPCLFEVGENSVIGGFSTISGHAVERGKIFFEKVKIGENCGVGLHAVVLPGALMEDGSMLGAQSLLLKKARIPGNETFGGVAAKSVRPGKLNYIQ